MAAGGIAMVGAPASAHCSGHTSHPNLDPAFDVVSGAGSTGLAVRAYPHTSCSLIVRIPNGAAVDLHCYGPGDSVGGNAWWSYIRYNGGTGNVYGWVSDYYLQDGGSDIHCP